MPTPDYLSGTDEIEPQDLITVWSRRNRDSRRVSFGQFQDGIDATVQAALTEPVESANAAAALSQLSADEAAQSVVDASAVLTGAAKKTELAADDGASLVNVKQPWLGSWIRSVFTALQDRVSVKDFGAIGDGQVHFLSERFSSLAAAQARYPFVTNHNTQTIDWAAFQASVNYVTQRGWLRRVGIAGSQQGGTVWVPSGCYLLSQQVVQPRSGLYDGKAIKWLGESMVASVVSGSESFPTGRGLFEWEETAQRTYFPHFEELTFLLPRTVLGVKGIWFAAVNASTTATIFNEYMHGLVMRRIIGDASNTVNEAAFQFDGYVRQSEFNYIRANFTRGGSPTYNTRLLKFPTNTGSDSQITGESNGLAYSKLESILGMGEQGGGGCVLEARLYECTASQILCGNQTVNGGPSLILTKCLTTPLSQVNVEGGNAQTPASIVIQDSEGVTISDIGLGSPNPSIASTGIAVINSKRTTLERRVSNPSSPAFSLWAGKAVRVDATSSDTVLKNFYLNADVAQEVEILAPASARNRIEWINPATNLRGDLGIRPGYVLAKATVINNNPTPQSIPSGAFTQVIFGTETSDPLGVYNPSTGTMTAPVAGRYRINCAVQFNNIVSAKQVDLCVSRVGGQSSYIDRVAMTGTETYRYLRGDLVIDAAAGEALGVGIFHNFGAPAAVSGFALLAFITFEFVGFA